MLSAWEEAQRRMREADKMPQLPFLTPSSAPSASSAQAPTHAQQHQHQQQQYPNQHNQHQQQQQQNHQQQGQGQQGVPQLSPLPKPNDKSKEGAASEEGGKEKEKEEGAAENWTAHKTGDGQVYYYNTVTGESTYKKPKGFKLEVSFIDSCLGSLAVGETVFSQSDFWCFG